MPQEEIDTSLWGEMESESEEEESEEEEEEEEGEGEEAGEGDKGEDGSQTPLVNPGAGTAGLTTPSGMSSVGAAAAETPELLELRYTQREGD